MLQLLVKPKDLVIKENVVGAAYIIKCEECEATYVDETERSLKSRFNEHRTPSCTTSEVAKDIHLEQPEHSVGLENTKIVITESRWFKRGCRSHLHNIHKPKPQQRWWKVSFASMGQQYGTSSLRRG